MTRKKKINAAFDEMNEELNALKKRVAILENTQKFKVGDEVNFQYAGDKAIKGFIVEAEFTARWWRYKVFAPEEKTTWGNVMDDEITLVK